MLKLRYYKWKRLLNIKKQCTQLYTQSHGIPILVCVLFFFLYVHKFIRIGCEPIQTSLHTAKVLQLVYRPCMSVSGCCILRILARQKDPFCIYHNVNSISQISSRNLPKALKKIYTQHFYRLNDINCLCCQDGKRTRSCLHSTKVSHASGTFFKNNLQHMRLLSLWVIRFYEYKTFDHCFDLCLASRTVYDN